MPQAATASAAERRLTLPELLDWLVEDGAVARGPADELKKGRRYWRGARHPLTLVAEKGWKDCGCRTSRSPLCSAVILISYDFAGSSDTDYAARPDLADAALEQVRAPTLLIGGGNDDVVIGLNEAAYQRLTCEKQLTIVPGASHLFEEPGALETVASRASDWFRRHLAENRETFT
jgi:pimeloyl-ACP methyl ester carboxylesterase